MLDINKIHHSSFSMKSLISPSEVIPEQVRSSQTASEESDSHIPGYSENVFNSNMGEKFDRMHEEAMKEDGDKKSGGSVNTGNLNKAISNHISVISSCIYNLV